MDAIIAWVCGGVVVGMAFTYWRTRQKIDERRTSEAVRQEEEAKVQQIRITGEVIKTAVDLNRSGNLSEAIFILQDWHRQNLDVEDDDNRLVAYHLLGIYLAEANRLQEAAPLLLKTASYFEDLQEPDTQSWRSAAMAREELARFYTTQNRAIEKRTHHVRASQNWELAGEKGLAARNLAYALEADGDFRGAAERYREAVEHPPDQAAIDYCPRLLIDWTLALWRAGDYTAALTVVRRALADDAVACLGNLAYRTIIVVLVKKGCLDEAEEVLSRVLTDSEKSRVSAELMAIRCLILNYRGHHSKIVSMCQDYLESNSAPVPSIYGHLGLALSALGQFGDASVAYRSAIELSEKAGQTGRNATHTLLHIGLVLVLIELGDLDQAGALLAATNLSVLGNREADYFVPALRLLIVSQHKDRLPREVDEELNALLRLLDGERVGFLEDTDFILHYMDVLLCLARARLHSGNAKGSLEILCLLGNGRDQKPGEFVYIHYWKGRCFELLGDATAARLAYELAVCQDCDPEFYEIRESRNRLTALNDTSTG